MSIKLKLNKKNYNKDYMIKSKLAMYMQKGLTINDAAKLVDVSDYKIGILRSDPIFEDFIQKCQIRFEYGHLENLKAASDLGAWQASAWVLERTRPDKYGKKDTIRHEFEMKYLTFKKIMIDVINTLDVSTRKKIMQRIRQVETDKYSNNPSENEEVFDLVPIDNCSNMFS